MKTTACFLLGCALFWTDSLAQQSGTSMKKADEAYQQLQLPEARKILTKLLQDDHTLAKDRAVALEKLALQDWKFFRNYHGAIGRLQTARSSGVLLHSGWLLRCRIEREAGHYSRALIAAKEAMAHAQSEAERIEGQLAYATTVYRSALTRLARNQAPDSALLNEGAQQLVGILRVIPGYAEPAKLLLGISLLQKDGPQALKAWLAYFHFVSVDSAYAYLKGPATLLGTLLPRWNHHDLSVADTKQLCRALAASRFYAYADLIAKSLNQAVIRSDSSLQAIIAYAQYLTTIERETNDYYRRLALGKRKGLERVVSQSSQLLLANLKLPLKDTFEFSDFLAVMEPGFGTAGYLGRTSAFKGQELALGHVVNCEKKVVRQYGYEGKLTFIQLDQMVANGYITWFTEKSGNGGWSNGDQIVQVRSRYLDEPITAWYLVTDSSTRKAQEELFLSTMSNAADIDSAAVLDALSAKLRLDALTELYNRLVGRGFRGHELRVQFITSFEKMLLDAAIFAHEGRHSIDQIYFAAEFEKASQAEREYRAKLSEIVYSESPKYILSMLVNRIGESGHGQANRKIIQTAVEWLSQNAKTVEAYEPGEVALKQVYRLTGAQIRECYQRADPLSHREAGK